MVTSVLPQSHRIRSVQHHVAKHNSRLCLSVALVSPSQGCYGTLRLQKSTIIYTPKVQRMVRLPVEVIGIILAQLNEHNLTQAALVNRLFLYECVRLLYRAITKRAPKHSVMLIRTLARSPELAAHVRLYTVSLKQAEPVGNVYRLLAKALSHMVNLHSLSFEIPGDKSWVLQGCSANIRWFKTSLEFDDKLANWVATKPLVHDLILTRTKVFPLRSNELPNLGIIFGTPQAVLSAIIGRPVRSVCFGLNGPVTLDLSSLAKTTVTVDHLGVAFDPLAGGEELNCIDFIYRCSMLLTNVQKLSFFATRNTFSHALYWMVVPLLAQFPHLRYLQFVLGDSDPSLVTSRATQLELLKGFYDCCPSLRNVSFPGNLTWNIE